MDRALHEARLERRSVERLERLELRIGAALTSGPAQAGRLTAIANALPLHLWLTRVDESAQGETVLQGAAADFERIADAIDALRSVRGLRTARLQTAMLPDRSAKRAAVRYALAFSREGK